VVRATLGVVAATAGVICSGVLVVPTAVASPESDANAAITAAWEGGGDKSKLGAKRGDIYPVGEGFAQDFAGGKVFFTPATGAKAMYGVLLEKYESLGGPAGSDLGFPIIDEAPGLARPDSRVSIFSASDKPVMFWTPDHGAYVVRGAINAAWDKLGSSGGVLGFPVGDETYNGEIASQPFSGGQVSWNRLTKVFTTVPPELAEQLTSLQIPVDPTASINMAWRAAGGEAGPLGVKQGEQYPIGGDGLAQNFAGGKVYFSPATGANAVEGDILTKYESLGGPVGSDLGFPIANEANGGIAPASRISSFSATDEPVIFWTPEHGAFVVRGVMKTAWSKLGGPTGELGAPVGDQALDGDVVTQKFSGGKIAWDRAKNTFSTEPANLVSQLSGLREPAQNPPAGPSAPSGTARSAVWRWWWWPVVVAVLLLLGMAGLVGLWRHRQHRRGFAGGDAGDTGLREPEDETKVHYGAVADPDRRWSADTDSAFGSLPFAGGYPEPPGVPPSAEPPNRATARWRPRTRVDVDLPEGAAEETDGAAAASEPGPDARADNSDVVDTAPTRVPLDPGRHAAVNTGEAGDAEPQPAAPAEPTHPAIHLPLEDADRAPDGYPVKGNASFGLYYTPGSTLYEDAFAEIWFTDEEIARVNGFTKAD
jgi:uncharacterized protein with LGFP repeats